MAKTTPWLEIKAAYLKGITPKELAQKYKIKAKAISDKANEEKWVAEKARISEKIRKNVEVKIDRITNLALSRLEDVLNDDEVRTGDLISAIGKAIDISGLKSSKQEITGKNGEALLVQKEYILPEEIEQFKEHYKKSVEG